MKVWIAGIDGYLGWPLAMVLASRGHAVSGVDARHRRAWVESVGSRSAIPILDLPDRVAAFGKPIRWAYADVTEYNAVREQLRAVRPDVIVHLAEQPSAPYSMIDVDNAVETQTNNVVGTLNILHAMRDVCPDAHLAKLGTMGEYGTPNVDIPEGFFDLERNGRTDRLLFPRQAGSWYHQSKVHDTDNVAMACRIWGLRATDIMQGVVYGTRVDEMDGDPRLATRFDFDAIFGTAINRFSAQAIVGHPITPYGSGQQRRGFIPLRDSMQCLTLAIENPADRGDFRVFNQFDETYSIFELSRKVATEAADMGLRPTIVHVDNPREESEDHYYNPDHEHLRDLGYVPAGNIHAEIRTMLADLIPHEDRIRSCSQVLLPDVRWDGRREIVQGWGGESCE